MKKTIVGSGLVLLVITIATFSSAADEIPPPGSKSVLAIAKQLEEAGFGPIVEVSFDDGVWEVEAYSQGVPYELSLNPLTGETIAKHRDEPSPTPPANSLRLSEILMRLEKLGYSPITDVSFEHRSWEVEAIREQQKRELRVDPMTGEVISDRVDD